MSSQMLEHVGHEFGNIVRIGRYECAQPKDAHVTRPYRFGVHGDTAITACGRDSRNRFAATIRNNSSCRALDHFRTTLLLEQFQQFVGVRKELAVQQSAEHLGAFDSNLKNGIAQQAQNDGLHLVHPFVATQNDRHIVEDDNLQEIDDGQPGRP